ncbi:hypothetical protein QLL95_gp1292 [Cotonvirus japonicus]|uniref:Uncharacterized protein n=1 Tax=Cotonvirus japonicus TaxID=2811091 RepID=A0ABM7NRQ3_9VIRU|nr:hypothetical protein QLL95_gp1292 [Cotonvirus japonicus]BCS82831.1 hypothetical protein [Cotonvirus japonicus]
MENIIKQIKKLNKNELKKLKDVIIEQENEIESQELILQIVPDIFRDKINSLSFDTNYRGDGFDEYKHINGCSHIIFDNGLTIDTDYDIHSSNNWNTGIVEIILNKEITPIFYECKNHNKRPNTIILQLDKKFLNILDRLNLEHNTYNKKMLGLLINNIISKTQTTCDDETDCYDINAIDIDNVKKLNTKKSLRKKKYMIYSDYKNSSIRFKFVNKPIDDNSE